MADASLILDKQGRGEHWYRVETRPWGASAFVASAGRAWAGFRYKWPGGAEFRWETGADRLHAAAQAFVRGERTSESVRGSFAAYFASRVSDGESAALEHALHRIAQGVAPLLEEGPDAFYPRDGHAHLEDCLACLPLPSWARVERQSASGLPMLVLGGARTMRDYANWVTTQESRGRATARTPPPPAPQAPLVPPPPTPVPPTASGPTPAAGAHAAPRTAAVPAPPPTRRGRARRTAGRRLLRVKHASVGGIAVFDADAMMLVVEPTPESLALEVALEGSGAWEAFLEDLPRADLATGQAFAPEEWDSGYEPVEVVVVVDPATGRGLVVSNEVISRVIPQGRSAMDLIAEELSTYLEVCFENEGRTQAEFIPAEEQ